MTFPVSIQNWVLKLIMKTVLIETSVKISYNSCINSLCSISLKPVVSEVWKFLKIISQKACTVLLFIPGTRVYTCFIFHVEPLPEQSGLWVQSYHNNHSNSSICPLKERPMIMEESSRHGGLLLALGTSYCWSDIPEHRNPEWSCPPFPGAI